jgi:Ankyrin repeat.
MNRSNKIDVPPPFSFRSTETAKLDLFLIRWAIRAREIYLLKSSNNIYFVSTNKGNFFMSIWGINLGTNWPNKTRFEISIACSQVPHKEAECLLKVDPALASDNVTHMARVYTRQYLFTLPALFLAVVRGNPSIVYLLLKYGAAVNFQVRVSTLVSLYLLFF